MLSCIEYEMFFITSGGDSINLSMLFLIFCLGYILLLIVKGMYVKFLKEC